MAGMAGQGFSRHCHGPGGLDGHRKHQAKKGSHETGNQIAITERGLDLTRVLVMDMDGNVLVFDRHIHIFAMLFA